MATKTSEPSLQTPKEDDKNPGSLAKDSTAEPTTPDTCPVCYDAFTTRCEVVPCGHEFDLECIQTWFSANTNAAKSCPCCRADMKEVKKMNETTGEMEIIPLSDNLERRNGHRRLRSGHGEYHPHTQYLFSSFPDLEEHISRVELEFADDDVPARNAMTLPHENQPPNHGNRGEDEREIEQEYMLLEEEILGGDELSRLVGVNLFDQEDERGMFPVGDLVRTGVIDEAWFSLL